MNSQKLTIVALDNPFPVDYGGVFDLFYKLEPLKNLGISIEYHFFCKKERSVISNSLKKSNSQSYSYPRINNLLNLFRKTPYFVLSRTSSHFLENILKNENPILWEGIHVCAYVELIKKLQPSRKQYLRLHNIEQTYYQELAKNETNSIKKKYFQFEAHKLQHFENKIVKIVDGIIAVSETERKWAEKINSNTIWILPFQKPFEILDFKLIENTNKKYLFHGNFLVNENVIAGKWLIDNLLHNLKKEEILVFAGKGLSKVFTNTYENKLVLIDSPVDMIPIIQDSDCIILPLQQKSGIKIKLLETLALGKPVLCTHATLYGSGLEEFLTPFESIQDLIFQLQNLSNLNFLNQIKLAQNELFKLYNPIENAIKLSNFMNLI